MHEAETDAQWRNWVQAHGARFLLFARQESRCEADAQDLVQEAILEACKRTGNRLPPAPALVFATIHRRAIDLARSRQRREGRELAMEQPAEPWFDTAVDQRETQLMIENAMRKLPEQFRQVVTLKIWGDLTFAEIAHALDIPANTAASRYRYAMAELRRLTSREVPV